MRPASMCADSPATRSERVTCQARCLIRIFSVKRVTTPPLAEGDMKPPRTAVLKLLDRSLIGLLIFIVMLLLGLQAVNTG